jgi:hypothetical protein
VPVRVKLWQARYFVDNHQAGVLFEPSGLAPISGGAFT